MILTFLCLFSIHTNTTGYRSDQPPGAAKANNRKTGTKTEYLRYERHYLSSVSCALFLCSSFPMSFEIAHEAFIPYQPQNSRTFPCHALPSFLAHIFPSRETIQSTSQIFSVPIHQTTLQCALVNAVQRLPNILTAQQSQPTVVGNSDNTIIFASTASAMRKHKTRSKNVNSSSS